LLFNGQGSATLALSILDIVRYSQEVNHADSATDAKQSFATALESAAREPVLIQKQKRDVAVVLSIADYEPQTRMNVQAF
jgi:hypothetical protein